MSEPTYPLTMPTSPNFIESEWTIKRAVTTSISPFTFGSQSAKYSGSQWIATVKLPPMKQVLAVEWQAFFMQLNGGFGTFLMGDPDALAVRGTISNTIAVNGSHAVGAYDIVIDGADISDATLFKKGDYVQFNSDASSKLHMIIANVASDASGNATLTIEPSLSAILTDNATISYTSPKCLMRMQTNDLSWSADQISLYGIAFACEEVR